MRRTRKIRSNRVYIVLIGLFLLLASFLRLWYLDRIPTGVVMDEFDYVLNASYVYHTGTNIYANWSPWSLATVPNEVPKGELTYWVSLPFVGPWGMSLLTARIGFALISIASVYIIFAIAASLFGTGVGIAAGFMAAINPWSVYFGRTAFDVPVSITLYLLAFLGLLKLKGPRLLLTLIPLFLAFYNYIGTKLLFVPFVLVSVIGIWYIVRKKQDTKWYALILLGALLIFGMFVLRIQKTSASLRMDQIFSPFDKDVVRDVNEQRRLTLSSPLIAVFANKPVVYLKELVTKFFGAFSPTLLFTNSEGLSTLSLWQHGMFYPVDAVFLLIGIAVLYRQAPLLMGLFALIIAIATIPSVFSTMGTNYAHRSALMYPFLTVLTSYGLVGVIRRFAPHTRKIAGGAVALAYVVVAANFVYLYFFRFPYYNSESFGLSQRLYSRYTALAQKTDTPVMHITESPELYLRNYIFYRDAIDQNTAPSLRERFIQKKYSWENATFTKTCPTKADIDTGTTTYILSVTSPCKEHFIQRPMTVIPSLSDGGTLYMIFNDRVCADYALSSYPTGYTMDDFRIEAIATKRFCERFIIRYANPLYQPQTREGNWISPE